MYQLWYIFSNSFLRTGNLDPFGLKTAMHHMYLRVLNSLTKFDDREFKRGNERIEGNVPISVKTHHNIY